MKNKSDIKQAIESEYKVLDAIEREPSTTQRNLAYKLNFSIGKVNYVLRSLFDRGLVKLGNFKESKDKHGYIYILTKEGVTEKLKITKLFLNEKIEEYEKVQMEIQELKEKLENH